MSGDEASKRVESLASRTRDLTQLKQKYDEIYARSDVWLYPKSQGIHSVILSLLPADLTGKRVLDVGCGAGRLAINCSTRGALVTGFDFSEPAVALAEMNAACAGSEARFVVDEIETFCAAADVRYDIAVMVGVLEHVPDPVTTLRSLGSIIADDGLLITSSPNFVNLRGFSYMTLLTLLDLPLSLADVRQVDEQAMQEWSTAAGWSYEQCLGAIYRFGWDERAAADMTKRLPLAVRDAKLEYGFDYGAYSSWLTRVCATGHELLEWLHGEGMLKRIEPNAPIAMARAVDVDEELWGLMMRYMDEDVTADPYYCDVRPLSTMGGEGIYVLRNAR